MSNNGLIPPSPDIPISSSTPYASTLPSITNTTISGTICPLATNYNNDGCYFIKKGEAIEGPLISTVQVFSSDLSKIGEIDVDNANGSMSISSGANPITSAPPRLGLNLASGASGIIATVGDASIVGSPTLQLSANVSGSRTFSRVFDEVFNPPTGVELVNILGPTVTPDYPNGWLTDSPNDGTLFGTAGSGAFDVPSTGLYMFQVTIRMCPGQTSTGGASGGAFFQQITINNFATPFVAVGGVVIGEAFPLSSSIAQPSYYSWNSYVPLVAGELYTLTVRMLAGSGVYLPPNLIDAFYPFADLKCSLIKIG